MERPGAVRRRSPVPSQPLGLLATIVGMVFVAVLSTVAIRFAVSFVTPTVSDPAQSAITPEQAIRRADLYVAEQYPEFLAVEPTATLALDGGREVFGRVHSGQCHNLQRSSDHTGRVGGCGNGRDGIAGSRDIAVGTLLRHFS